MILKLLFLTEGAYSISTVTDLFDPELVTIPGLIQKSAILNLIPRTSYFRFGEKKFRILKRRLSKGLKSRVRVKNY